MKKTKLTWEDIEKLCTQLTDQIYDKVLTTPKFNTIVTISKGGLIPARLIAETLDVQRIVTVGISSYKQEKQTKFDVYQTITDPLIGQRVLIIDDIADSGKSLSYVKELINEHNPDSIKICTLHYKSNSSIKPDFFGKKVLNSEWIVYPWELKNTN
jgi:hypoxanthine phosphoribosyltransferase